MEDEATQQNKSVKGSRAVVSAMSSLKLTVILLLVISLCAVVGTIIPQKDAAEPLSYYLKPGVISFLNTIQFFDIYHSYWFSMLVGALCLNIIVCSLVRLRRNRRRSTERSIPPMSNHLNEDRIIGCTETLNDSVSQISNILHNVYRRVENSDAQEGKIIYGERGYGRRLFTYIIHTGVLIIIGGMFIGHLYKVDGHVEIIEGESTDKIYLRDGGSPVNLGFSVRCDDFGIEYYDNGMLREYRSDLSFLKDENVLYRTPVLVNHPASFEGMRFYQWTYGVVPEAHIAIINGTETKRFTVRPGSTIELGDNGTTAHILGLRENFMRLGPAVIIGISSVQGSYKLFIFQNVEKIQKGIPKLFSLYPQFNPASVEPYTFALERIGTRYYTGLMVNRDPGAGIVAAGGICLFVGLLAGFLLAQKRIWILIHKQENGIRVRIAVDGRNRAGVDRAVLLWLDSKRQVAL